MFQTFPTLRESVVIYILVSDCLYFTYLQTEKEEKTKYLKPKSWRKIYQWHEKGWKDNWTFGEKQIIHDHKPLADRKVFCHIEAHDQIFLPPRIFAAIFDCSSTSFKCIEFETQLFKNHILLRMTLAQISIASGYFKLRKK